MRIFDIRTEYEQNAKFIFEKRPRFSWKINSEENNVIQTSYVLIVKNAATGKEMWNSGQVESDQSVHP